MNRNKIFFSTLLVIILLAIQVVAVGAAPALQETPTIEGTIESITLETDPDSGVITVVVVYVDDEGVTQTVELTLEEAIDLELVIDDGTGTYIVDETKLPAESEGEHPVGSAIAAFFTDLLNVDYTMIMEYHGNGAGFGNIAQALWMTNALEGDSALFSAIIEAKINKDFSAIELPDGSTPTNWGQFRKAVMSDRAKSKENLGAIMSGRATVDLEEDDQTDLKANDKTDDSTSITGEESGKPDKSKGKIEKGNGKPDKENGKTDKDKGKPDKTKSKPEKGNGKPDKTKNKPEKGNGKPDKNKGKGKGKK